MNGKLVVTGAKTEAQVYEAVHKLRKNLIKEKLI
jgi:TATA-box binding protein (TBP) (component of TFIID and TFIIIB)